MPRILRAFALAALLLIPAAARASGAWNVYIRPSGFRDVLAQRETVWVTTREAGLLRFLRSSGRFESITREPGALASNSLTTLAYDRSGRLWVGTNGRGVCRLSADGRTWRLINAFDGLPSDSVSTLTADGDTVWIGTMRGIALWNGREVSGALPDGVNPSPFELNDVSGIVVDGDTLLVSTSSGVYMARKSQNLSQWTAVNGGLSSTSVSALAKDTRDIFALADGGTYRWQPATATWGLASGNGSVRRLRADFGRLVSISSVGMYEWNGSSWVAMAGSPASTSSTGDGGVEPAIDPDGVGFAASAAGLLVGPAYAAYFPPGPSGNDVNSVVASGGSVYVGTQGQFFSRLRGGVWRIWGASDACPTCVSPTDTSFRYSEYVLGLFADPNGVKWVGCWGGTLSRLDDSGPVPRIYNIVVNDAAGFQSFQHSWTWSAASGKRGARWFGLDTGQLGFIPPIGLDLYDSTGAYVRSFQPGYPGLRSGQIRALEIDRNDRMWIGYAGKGLDYADVSNYNLGDALVLNQVVSLIGQIDVFAIKAYGRDSLWVLATDGLRRISASARFPEFTGSTPTLPIAGAISPRGAVHPMDLTPDGNVWVGTQGGVRRYKARGVFEDLTEDNSPLPSNDVRGVSRDAITGLIWFATGNGVASYDPRYVTPAEPRLPKLEVLVYPNPVQLTGIGFEMRLKGNAQSYEGSVYDIGGRLLRTFKRGANGGLVWDGRDSDGTLVRPGLYFVRVKGGGAEATARIAVVR